jgi:GNAT superfamily N-acetyltransferase
VRVPRRFNAGVWISSHRVGGERFSLALSQRSVFILVLSGGLRHTELGQNICNKIPHKDALKVGLFVRHHHEAFDGSGYPDGLSGEQIPICSRIISIVDTYDAMLTTRPYHDARPHKQVMDLMERECGTKIDPFLFGYFEQIAANRIQNHCEVQGIVKGNMDIEYKINAPVTTDQFIALLRESTLGERRPIDDRECMEGMINNSNLMVTAWRGDELIGMARSMTDFHYACYLSDLAVHRHYQKTGVGKKLQIITQEKLGPKCKLILIAAPSANAYYEHIGYTNNQRCWVLGREQSIRR